MKITGFAASLQPVNYTTNATGQSQLQMNGVVDTFAALMGTVVADFRNMGRHRWLQRWFEAGPVKHPRVS